MKVDEILIRFGGLSKKHGVKLSTLLSAPYHQVLEIRALQGDAHLSLRLRELGFRPGVQVQVIGRAPFGGPLLVQIQLSVVALRKVEAECILIVPSAA